MFTISDRAVTVVGIICGAIAALTWIVVLIREVIDGHREQVLMNIHRRNRGTNDRKPCSSGNLGDGRNIRRAVDR